MALAAERAGGAGSDGGIDQALDLGDSSGVDQRADLCAVAGTVADLEGADGGVQLGREGIVDAAVHEEAVGADAGLTGVAVLRGECA